MISMICNIKDNMKYNEDLVSRFHSFYRQTEPYRAQLLLKYLILADEWLLIA